MHHPRANEPGFKEDHSHGIYDWEAKEKNQVVSKSFFLVRYAAVLGNELFNIVEHNGNQVSLASVSRLLGSQNSCGL